MYINVGETLLQDVTLLTLLHSILCMHDQYIRVVSTTNNSRTFSEMVYSLHFIINAETEELSKAYVKDIGQDVNYMLCTKL